jgi:hypothetical protein
MPTTTITPAAGQVWTDRMTGDHITLGEQQASGRFIAHYGRQITGELNAETLEQLYERESA